MTTGYEVCRAQIKEKVMEVLQAEESVGDAAVFACIEEIAQGFAS